MGCGAFLILQFVYAYGLFLKRVPLLFPCLEKPTLVGFGQECPVDAILAQLLDVVDGKVPEKSCCEFVKNIQKLCIEKLWITGDVRDGRGDERWLNIILRRKIC